MASKLLTMQATDATNITVVSIHVDRLRAGRGGKRIQCQVFVVEVCASAVCTIVHGRGLTFNLSYF